MRVHDSPGRRGQNTIMASILQTENNDGSLVTSSLA